MKPFFAILFGVALFANATAKKPADNYLVIGDRTGDVKLNQRTAGIGDTVFSKDIITIGSKAGSSVWLYTPSGKNRQFTDKGVYKFSRLMDSIQILKSESWYAKLWSYIWNKTKEHHKEESADNTEGGIEKAVVYFSPVNYHLLLEDTITFEWRNLRYSSKARFILADTVLFDSTGRAYYMNQVIDTNISLTNFKVDMQRWNLRTDYAYYWCVNYEGAEQYKFHPFYYVAPNEREEVQELLNQLNHTANNNPSAKMLKDVFVKSFF